MHKYPAIHNAMWPGLVGKGPGAEPPIDLDTMLDLTAAASVDGVKFDGVTAGLRINASVHAPLACVANVFDVASGDLSLPGRIMK